MDLTDEELKYTRRKTGIDTMIEVDERLINEKIKELKRYQKLAGYDDDWYFFEGEIKALGAIKEYKLGEL